jgi:hypothetical protein
LPEAGAADGDVPRRARRRRRAAAGRRGRCRAGPPEVHRTSVTAVFFCLSSTYFRGRSEKRPSKPDLCSVSGKSGGTRDQPCHDRSFKQRNALPAAGHALTGLPGGGRHRAPSRHPPRGRPAGGAVPSCGPGGCRPVPARGSGPGVKAAPAPGRVDLTRRPEWRVDACGPGRQASPPRRPATGPAATAPGNGGTAPEVTARDPAPAPAGLPLRQGRAARQHPPRRAARPRGLSPSPVSPQQPQAGAGRRQPGGDRT